MKKVNQSFQRVLALIKSINEVGIKLSNAKVTIFRPITIPVTFNQPHSCFLQLINWLYSLTVEVSSPSFNFISKKAKLDYPGTPRDVWDVIKLIHSLRTYHGHSLDLTKYRNVEIKNYCLDWYQSQTSKTEPDIDDEWLICIQYVLERTINYLETMLNTLNRITDKDEKEIFQTEWFKLIERDYPVHKFEMVLETVLDRYGLGGIFDTNALTKLEIEKWRKELDSSKEGFDFDKEADRIIVKYVEQQELCPVTGGDLIELGVPKGSHIKLLMKEVRELFYKSPCNKKDLLIKINESGILNQWIKTQ